MKATQTVGTGASTGSAALSEMGGKAFEGCLATPPDVSPRRPVLDAVLLIVGMLLSIFAAVVLVVQYRPVLFRHDTAFIGLSLAILSAFAVVVGLDRKSTRLNSSHG